MSFISTGRRNLLRGILGGTAVTVGLPFLDIFLNTNGTAFADGAPLPVVFGTWWWGCGLNPGRWTPKTAGKLTEFGPELQPLTPIQDKINLYSGMNVFMDGKPMNTHHSGAWGITTGAVPRGTPELPSVDTLIADVVGTKTRFRSLEVTCSGTASQSFSRRNGSVVNPSEISPAALYTRIFGAEFRDPNAAEFKPDASVMLRRSALSAVTEERQAVVKDLGAADRARLDEYFTSLRNLEQQLDLQLQKPAPMPACSVSDMVPDGPVGMEVAVVRKNHELFIGLLTHALACGQTNVFNILFNEGQSQLCRSGKSQSHHECTHDEPVDLTLGYQPEVTYFISQIVESFGEIVSAFDSFREGDHTLLDRTLILATTDHSYAKVHGLVDIPLMTAGKAGGRMKTGLHVRPVGDPATRLGLTVQQAMGVPVSTWGTDSNQTSKTITEVLA